MSDQSIALDLSKIKMSYAEVTSFQIRNGLQKTFHKKDIKGADFKFETEFGYNFEDKFAFVKLFIEIKAIAHNPTQDNIGGNCTIEFAFDVEDLERYFEGKESQMSEGEFGVDHLFVCTLLGLSFSTARGIIFSRSLGTMLDGILLPIVAPKDLLSPVR